MNRASIVLLAIGVSAASPPASAAECDGGVWCGSVVCPDSGHVPFGADAGACPTPAIPNENMAPPEEEDPGSCHCLWTSPNPSGLAALGLPLVVGGLARRLGRRRRP